MPKKGIIIFIFFFFATAQHIVPQSNKSVNLDKLPVTDKVSHYLELSNASFEKNKGEAIDYAKKALELSVNSGNLKLSCQCLNQLAEMYNSMQNFQEEKSCYIKGIEYSKKINDFQELYQFYISLGQLEKNLSNFQSSIDYYLQSLRILENREDKTALPLILNNIGISYYKLSRYDEALKYYLKALSLNETKKNKTSTIRTLVNIGSVYIEMRNFQKALSYFEQSLKETEGSDLKNLRSVIYNNIGNIYLGQNDYIKAIDNHEKALRIKIDIKDQPGIGSSYNNIGTAYEALGRYNVANEYYQKALNQYKSLSLLPGIATSLRNIGNISIKLGNLPMAEKSLKEALAIADSNNLLSIKADIYYSFAIFYSTQSKHKESDYYYNKHINLNDSLNNASFREKVAQMEVLYDTEKKDRENRLLKLENEKKEVSIEQQKSWLFFLIIFVILITGLAVLIYQFYKNRKKSALILAEKNRLLTESEENLRIINATKDRFFSIISHDLRNPFASLGLIVDNLKINLAKRNFEKLDNVLISLDRSVAGTKNLLTNLLEWSMTQTGKMEYNPQRINLSELISASVTLFDTPAKSKNQKISLSMDDNIQVVCDKYMIDTVIRNLVTNAIKFTPRNGNITVVTSRKNGFAEVSVIDSGIGIPDNKLSDLFKIDTKVKSRGTENEAGTGLGLILCKEFIDKHNGKIYANSELNKGSKFSFTLPVSE